MLQPVQGQQQGSVLLLPRVLERPSLCICSGSSGTLFLALSSTQHLRRMAEKAQRASMEDCSPRAISDI